MPICKEDKPFTLCHPELVSGSRNSQAEKTPLTRIYKFASSLINSTLSSKGRGEKAAFTLAEVLITLGIIGVVAALTLPTLIQNYKKHETITRLKKAYTVVANALKMSEVENGEFENWEIPATASEYAEKYFLPYFNSPKLCKTYQECGYDKERPFHTINGSTHNMLVAHNNFRIPIVLNDGTYVSFSIAQGNQEQGTGNRKSSSVTFDINGAKAPNAFGKDIFSFEISTNGKGLQPVCTEDDGSDGCELENSSGWTCACRIIENGWEIPDDYPVKL